MLTHFVQTFGYLAIFVLMTLESALLPIPSEITMPFAGYLASQGTLDLWAVIMVGTVGNLAGSLAAYYLGQIIEERALVRWIRRYGRYLLIRESDYHRGVAWFAKYGGAAAFFYRIMPGIRTYLSLPAGMFEMNVTAFSLYTFSGSLLWSGFLAWIGYSLGSDWGSVSRLVRPLEYLVGAALIGAVAYYLYRRLSIRRSAGGANIR